MLCSATGRPFSVTFTRESENERFRIDSIDAGNGTANGASGASCGKPDAKPQSFSASEFDFTGFACPHCGHKRNGAVAAFFGCHCGKLQCGARIRIVNNVTHATCHDGCGRTGILSGTMEFYAGDEGSAKDGRKALAGPLKRLAAGPLKRLGGPRR